MAFTLSRTGDNVAAEVQRWQYFLLRIGIVHGCTISADFDERTEAGTKAFQRAAGIAQSGRVDDATLTAAAREGYTILPDDYYDRRASPAWPPAPDHLQIPTNDWRNREFGSFEFLPCGLAGGVDKEAIIVKGSCDGSASDWTAKNIVAIKHPAFQYAEGYRGRIRCHVRAAPVIRQLLSIWKERDLLHLVISYAGCYVPRYVRGKEPAAGADRSLRSSRDVPELSNHSFGSAFDINAAQNWIGATPALCGSKGSVRELVAAANECNVYWGGHFAHRADGMHFELTERS